MVLEIEKKLKRDYPLAPLTTIKLGGRTKWFIEGESEEEIMAALRYAASRDWPVHVLGGGSNTVFADEGFDGLVIKVANKGVEWEEKKGVVFVTAAAGEQWSELVNQCVAVGMTGFERMAGIPGTVGAAPVQNIGAYGQEVSGVIKEVDAIDIARLTTRGFTQAECGFGYRASRFKRAGSEQMVITKVVFKAAEQARSKIDYPDLVEQLGGEQVVEKLDDSIASLTKMKAAVLAVRERKAMLFDGGDGLVRSCGSFFMNPVVSKQKLDRLRLKEKGKVPSFIVGDQLKVPAAWLIERAGFPKGYRYKGVGISPYHNLSLVNYNGTAGEINALAENIKRVVKNKFKVSLVEEPVMVGFKRPVS